jgi:peptidoglycan/xylan/chitin deacetylase (PgdA/CDA1 family)
MSSLRKRHNLTLIIGLAILVAVLTLHLALHFGVPGSLSGPPSAVLRTGEMPVRPLAVMLPAEEGRPSATTALDGQATLLPVGAGAKRLIALTFDDFPFPDATPKMLEVLAEQQVQVTFFTIGHKLTEHPEFAAQALYQGHALENHTYDHVRLIYCTPEQIHRELSLCNQVIRDLTGVAPHYLRCPGGRSNATIDQEALANGLQCVDPLVTDIGDMGKSPAAIVRRCEADAHPGAIFSLHDGVPETMAALPIVIPYLRSKGYEFVTVERLLRGE